MTKSFGGLVFTPAVKALQERYGSRRQYAQMEKRGETRGGLGPEEKEFLSEQDSFFMASIGASGWPYVQHRGGPKGFLKAIDDNTIAFADFRGNRQYISTGNVTTDNRVALIFVDYPRQLRFKILGRAEIFEGDHAKDWLPKVRDANYQAVVERVYVIHVEAFEWNCPQHITPRFTEEEIREVLEPLEKQMAELAEENRHLRKQLDHLTKNKAPS